MAAKFIQVHKNNYHGAYAIHRSGQLNPWSESVFVDCLDPPYFAYNIEHNDVTIGYYICLRVLDEATLMDIGVHSKYQSKGWGSRVLEHFIQQCEIQNVATIWLEVRLSNHSAIQLYEKAGFILIEQRKRYYLSESGREDALVMKYIT
jgi:ribosomal-protein-alanine N-acetyltransferase